MKIQVIFVRWFVLIVCFLSSSSWANYNRFPIEDPQVTGTFMEYRPTVTSDGRRIEEHFHGGIDLISGASNNIVRPVANGELTYTIREHDIEGSTAKKDTTYTLWIRHSTGTYAGLGTRYLHVGEYPGAKSDHPKFHHAGMPQMIMTSDTLGTIVTPHDGIDDHLHFEVFRRSDLDYINPLSKLPAIADAGINYATADADPWTWTVIDDSRGYVDYDVTAHPSVEAEAIPPGEFRLLFEGFDRINTTTNRVGFYSIKASFLRTRTINGEVVTDSLLRYKFTADRLPRSLYESPHYLYNDQESVPSRDGHKSTKSQFYYRLFADDDSNNLSIDIRDLMGNVPDYGRLDLEGYIDGDEYGVSSQHYFEVEVGDFSGESVSKRLLITATAIGDLFSDLRARSGSQQVTLSWYSFRAGSWTEFQIQRSQDSGVSYTTIGTVPYDPTSEDDVYEYVDHTATSDLTYYYKIYTDELYGPVWARPSGGNSAPLPGTPVISIGDTGAGYFGLIIYTGANYADGYRVEYGPVGQSFPWSASMSGTHTETVFDNSLTAGTYEVRVRAHNATGNGSYSNVAQFSLAVPSKPATPTGTVQVVQPGSDRGWVLMNWAPNSEDDVVGYRIYCFDGTEYQPVADADGSSWSSLGADIWPTDAEIADGRYALHADGSGTGLKNDPHQVYTNSPSSTHNDSINYWFAVKAKNRLGNLSELSDPWKPTLPGASGTLLQDETWAGYVRVSGDVTVPDGVTLTIESGAVVQFLANTDNTGSGNDTGKSELIVAGTLDASAADITFRSSNDADDASNSDWYGIHIESGGRATLTNVTIRDGVRCAQAAQGGSLALTNPTLVNCGTPPTISFGGSDADVSGAQ